MINQIRKLLIFHCAALIFASSTLISPAWGELNGKAASSSKGIVAISIKIPPRLRVRSLYSKEVQILKGISVKGDNLNSGGICVTSSSKNPTFKITAVNAPQDISAFSLSHNDRKINLPVGTVREIQMRSLRLKQSQTCRTNERISISILRQTHAEKNQHSLDLQTHNRSNNTTKTSLLLISPA